MMTKDGRGWKSMKEDELGWKMMGEDDRGWKIRLVSMKENEIWLMNVKKC